MLSRALRSAFVAGLRQRAANNTTRNRLICAAVVLAGLILIILLTNNSRGGGGSGDDSPVTGEAFDSGIDRITQPPLSFVEGRRHVGEGMFRDPSIIDQRLKAGTFDYARAVCNKSMSMKLLKHVMSFPLRFHRGDPKEDEGHKRRPRTLIFVGDSHALRMFRWTAMFLYLGGFLKPDASDRVGDNEFVMNMDLGVSAEKKALSFDLVPNSARLLSIQFRRAVFVDHAAEMIRTIDREFEHLRRNSDAEGKKFLDAVIFVSVGSWDILRPEQDVHHYTLSSLVSEAAASHRSIDQVLERTFDRWRASLHNMNQALEETLGEYGFLVGSRVNWRWAGPPNCTADRFNPPRATEALHQLCPVLSKHLWVNYMHAARDVVSPNKAIAAAAAKFPRIASHVAFHFYEQIFKAPGCEAKLDGVHPTHVCTAKEAGASLFRALS